MHIIFAKNTIKIAMLEDDLKHSMYDDHLFLSIKQLTSGMPVCLLLQFGDLIPIIIVGYSY